MRAHVCACEVKGKADKLHFLLAADQVPPALSPINMLKDNSVKNKKRKTPRSSAAMREVKEHEGRKKK